MTFPPEPQSFRGRNRELAALVRLVRAQRPMALALVGGGGSGKSTLACALGHALRRELENRVFWVRIGAWDRHTVFQLLAVSLEIEPSEDVERAVRRSLAAAPSLVVLDNHESDATTAALLDDLRELPVTWIITARRCLLSGVQIHPVTPPLVALHASPFPSVASLTRLLRWHPVALDLADALVSAGVLEVGELEKRLRRRGVDRIVPLAHEDDVVEVRAMVEESMRTVSTVARRMLAVLAGMRGDDMDATALAALARESAAKPAALQLLRARRLIQEPRRDRFALHATVRHAVRARLRVDEDAIALYYLRRLEDDPRSRENEETHLFGLMDWAQERGELDLILRVHALTSRF
ncbi:MAG: hypothetical protein U0271_41230 [Polyangiaceae bacterium]